MGYKYDVFVSYKGLPPLSGSVASPNGWHRRFAELVERHLQIVLPSGRVRVYFSEREMNPGNIFTEQLPKELQCSKCLLALVSEDYFDSNYCCYEWDHFENRVAVATPGARSRGDGTGRETGRASTERDVSLLILPVTILTGNGVPERLSQMHRIDFGPWYQPYDHDWKPDGPCFRKIVDEIVPCLRERIKNAEKIDPASIYASNIHQVRPSSPRDRGMIVSFSSVRGQSGRTVALANVATYLAGAGKRVIVVDWESGLNGVARYFKDYPARCGCKDKRRSIGGLVEVLRRRQSERNCDWDGSLLEARPSESSGIVLNILSPADSEMPLSEQEGVDWRSPDLDSQLESLCQEWAKTYDYVLINVPTSRESPVYRSMMARLPDVLVRLYLSHDAEACLTELRRAIDEWPPSRPKDRADLRIIPILARCKPSDREWGTSCKEALREIVASWWPPVGTATLFNFQIPEIDKPVGLVMTPGDVAEPTNPSGIRARYEWIGNLLLADLDVNKATLQNLLINDVLDDVVGAAKNLIHGDDEEPDRKRLEAIGLLVADPTKAMVLLQSVLSLFVSRHGAEHPKVLEVERELEDAGRISKRSSLYKESHRESASLSEPSSSESMVKVKTASFYDVWEPGSVEKIVDILDSQGGQSQGQEPAEDRIESESASFAAEKLSSPVLAPGVVEGNWVSSSSSVASKDAALAHERTGSMYMIRGELMPAMREYDRAIRIWFALFREDNQSTEYQEGLAGAYLRMSDVLKAAGYAKLAAPYDVRALQLRAILVGEGVEDGNGQRKLALANERMGDARYWEKEYGGAWTHYNEALNILAVVVGHDGESSDDGITSCRITRKLGDVEARRNQFGPAQEMYQGAISLAQALRVSFPGLREVLREEAEAELRMGDLVAPGEPDRALSFYHRALTIRREILRSEPDDTSALRGLTRPLERIGDLQKERNDAEALRSYGEALELIARLLKLEGENSGLRRSQAICLRKIGNTHLAAGHPEEARKHFILSVRIGEKLAKAEPTRIEYQRELVVSLLHASEMDVPGAARQAAETIRSILRDEQRRIGLGREQKDWIPIVERILSGRNRGGERTSARPG